MEHIFVSSLNTVCSEQRMDLRLPNKSSKLNDKIYDFVHSLINILRNYTFLMLLDIYLHGYNGQQLVRLKTINSWLEMRNYEISRVKVCDLNVAYAKKLEICQTIHPARPALCAEFVVL